MASNRTTSSSVLDNLEYEDFLENDLPVTAYLAILSVIGTFGNLHAVFVYALRYKLSNHKTFIVWLSCIDLIACGLSIPFELYDIRHNYTFTSIIGCKFFRFLNHFVSICSGTLLGVIAVERFRKACLPLGRQVTERQAKLACIFTVGVSIAISSPAFVLYDVAEEEIPNYSLNSTDCTVANSYKGTISFKIYNIFLLLLSTGVFIVCVIMYIFIGRALFAHMRFVKTSHHPGKDARRTRRKHFDRSKQITFMFLVATAVSYIGYLPYIFLTILKAAMQDSYDNVKSELGSFNAVFLRGYFISNVANPIVYCFLDDRFRHECKITYARIGAYLRRMCSKKTNLSSIKHDSVKTEDTQQ